MKHWILVVALLPSAAAANAQDYAWQWPIELPREGEPAYEVLLDEAVYAAAADPLLRDISVLDGAGNLLPSAMQPARDPAEGAADLRAVLWFLLPGDAAPSAEAADLAGRFESAGVALRWKLPDNAASPAPELLLDLGGEPWTARAVIVEAAGDEPIWRARIEVLGSSDLQRWTQVAAPTSLYQLAQDGHRLTLLRIGLDRAAERYLRLRHVGDSARGAISGVQVEHRANPLVEREPLRWLRLEGTAAEDGKGWEYQLPGAMRIEAWSLDAGQGNWVLRADLASRAGSESGWQPRAVGERYQWQVDGERIASPPGVLPALRDKQWRLVLGEARAAAPALLLGYRPDRLLFLPEVDPPYRLVAGSANARRTDAPTRAVLAAIRQQRGKDWQPPTVALGPPTPLAGDAALVPARVPVDWRNGLLWAVLIAVAGSVVVIALKLLKQPEGEQG